MPRKPHTTQVTAEQAGTTEPAGAAETVVATLGGISPDGPNPRVLVEASCDVVGGATATTMVARIRRGNSVAGTLVTGAFTQTVVAGATQAIGVQAFDQPNAELASQPYVLTIEQPAASTNPKVTNATITATF